MRYQDDRSISHDKEFFYLGSAIQASPNVDKKLFCLAEALNLSPDVNQPLPALPSMSLCSFMWT